MFLAIYARYQVTHSEKFDLIQDAIDFLIQGKSSLELFPLCVYDTGINRNVFRYHWPDGQQMTDEQLKPHINEILQQGQ